MTELISIKVMYGGNHWCPSDNKPYHFDRTRSDQDQKPASNPAFGRIGDSGRNDLANCGLVRWIGSPHGHQDALICVQSPLICVPFRSNFWRLVQIGVTVWCFPL
jgi:hypothetical protein